MIGFGPGGIDCAEVVADVYLYLDDESDPAVQSRVREHLQSCAPCLRHYGLEQDVISRIARSCGGDTAPGTLKSRIRLRLTEVVIEAAHLEYRAE